MSPHQQRVIDERSALVEKIVSLGRFLGTEQFGDLETIDQYLLQRQLEVMRQYGNILNSRIERFNNTEI